jgi:hypothetical protein
MEFNFDTTITEGLHNEINKRHEALEKGLRLNVLEAIAIGSLLLEARAGTDYGDWQNWVKEKIRFSLRTAQRYIELTEHQEALGRSDTLSFLSLTEARQELAKGKRSRKRKKGEGAGESGHAGSEVPAGEETGEPSPPPPPWAPRPKDATGREIPEGCALAEGIEEAFAVAGDEIDVAMRRISDLKGDILAEMEGSPVWMHLPTSEWTLQCDNLRGLLKFARPHAVCPYCKGNGGGCDACKDQGWVTKRIWETTPKEMR